TAALLWHRPRRRGRIQRNGGDGTVTGAQLRRPDAMQSSMRRVSSRALPSQSAVPKTNKMTPTISRLTSRRSAGVSGRRRRSPVGPRVGRSAGGGLLDVGPPRGRLLDAGPVEFVFVLTCSSCP